MNPAASDEGSRATVAAVPRLRMTLLSMPKLGLGTWKMRGAEG